MPVSKVRKKVALKKKVRNQEKAAERRKRARRYTELVEAYNFLEQEEQRLLDEQKGEPDGNEEAKA